MHSVYILKYYDRRVHTRVGVCIIWLSSARVLRMRNFAAVKFFNCPNPKPYILFYSVLMMAAYESTSCIRATSSSILDSWILSTRRSTTFNLHYTHSPRLFPSLLEHDQRISCHEASIYHNHPACRVIIFRRTYERNQGKRDMSKGSCWGWHQVMKRRTLLYNARLIHYNLWNCPLYLHIS